MSKRIVWIVWVLVAGLLLAACGGGDSQTGVELKAAGGGAQPTATPTVEPVETAAPADSASSADIGPLAGTLLLLRGATFELYDVATGERTVIEGPYSYSPAFLNEARTHGAFSAFPDFGVLDIAARTVTVVENRASNPNGFALSPDGVWLMTFTGQLTNRLQVLAVDGSAAHNVATSSAATFGAVWTADSKLVWWLNQDVLEYMVFDPQAGESVALGQGDPQIVPPVAVAPDGARASAVPVAFRPQNPDTNPGACFDSYVEFFDPPFTLLSMNANGSVLWTERGLVASSAQWLDADRLLFARLGTGECGDVQGEPDRRVLMLDATAAAPEPVAVAGPLGNADDPNDRTQRFGKDVTHLYSPAPDGRYIAWIGGGINAQESVIYVTDVQTGATAPLLRMTREEAGDAANYIENGIFRQVAWLE